MEAGNATPGPKPVSGFNRWFTRWLTSPLGFLSGRAALIRYTGRVSGRAFQLPVNVYPYGDDLLIRVGKPESKTWWRNFSSPWSIEVVRGRRIVRGTGVAVAGNTGRGQRIAEDYFATHRGAARRAGLPDTRKGEHATPEQLSTAAACMVFVVVTPERQA